MTIFPRVGRSLAVSVLLLAATVGGARAQDVTDEQIKAARATIAALGVTDSFDNILPNLAERLKNTLIQSSPNYQEMITTTVDEKAIALAARRADLENEAAAIYARAFTIEELNAITAFYTSAAGMKLIKDGPIATRELMKAADIWASGVSRDLSDESAKSLDAAITPLPQVDPAAPVEAPATPPAPAE